MPPGPERPPVSSLVIRVSDGDSIVVDTGREKVEVRLVGINAPESGECYYQEAADHLAALVGGKDVEVAQIGTDQFGRTLAFVRLAGTGVNLDMVIGGFAVATTPGEPGESELLRAEEEAFAARRGLWAIDACGRGGPIPSVSIDGPGSRPDPAGRDERALDAEWVRLVSDEPTDLGGWTLRDESSAHRCSLGEGYVPAPVLDITSADPCWEPGNAPIWNNGGDMALLLDREGRVVARYRYEG